MNCWLSNGVGGKNSFAFYSYLLVAKLFSITTLRSGVSGDGGLVFSEVVYLLSFGKVRIRSYLEGGLE